MVELTDKITISRVDPVNGGGVATAFTVQELIDFLDTLYTPL